MTKYHYENCQQYRKILDFYKFDFEKIKTVEEVPFIPVRLFKEYELLSVEREQIIKTMTSSGTAGQTVSKILLDRVTATNQTKILTKIVSAFIGTKRLPMLIIDTSAILKNRNMLSARGAGILGFSMFGSEVVYALDENMQIDFELIQNFLAKHQGATILVFGFTFMIWEHFHYLLLRNDIRLNIANGIMIHGGGWKKLLEQEVDNVSFKKALNSSCGINKVHNYYGMVEQTGSIYIECEAGYLHAPIFSDIVIRNHTNFDSCEFGVQGLVQLVSLLPFSYPGHSILTEDMGEIVGEDDCLCGRKGKYFKIYGRIKNAEVRGCSDTYAPK